MKRYFFTNYSQIDHIKNLTYHIIMASSEIEQYKELLTQTISQLDSLIYEIEDYTLTPRSREKDFQDLKFDAIPILRKLKDARKYAQQSKAHYGTVKRLR